MNYYIKHLFFLVLINFIGKVSAQDLDKPNVLFVISDDLATTAISAYENSSGHTPNIDRLAAEGVKYTHAYSQYPVCGPSRASIMFGYYPSATKTYGSISGRENVGPERKSWTQLFKENGYYTARVSKIFHMGMGKTDSTTALIDGTNGQDDDASWTERFNAPGPEWRSEGEKELLQNNPFGLGFQEFKQKEFVNKFINVKAEGHDLIQSDGKVAEKASELIKLHKDEPFFLAVGFIRPHVPFVAPKVYFEPYPYEQVVLPPQVMNDWNDIPAAGINYVTSKSAQMSEEQKKKNISGYYASVSFMDAQLGKILNTLREEGLEDNTIIVFTSDHGFHLGEHDFWMKVGMHEESVRVPLIIKVPGKAPAVCHSLVELLDLYPTVAELAGLETSSHLQGESLVKTLDDPTYKVRDMAFSMENYGGTKAYLVRTQKWAYIQYGEDAKEGMELYDMEFDHKQYNNLAHFPQYSGLVKRMKKNLKQKLEEVRTNDLGITY